MTMTRFDLPANFRHFLETALDLRVVDGSTLVFLGRNHGDDWRTIGGEIIEIAFADHHCPRGAKRHSAIVKAWDALNAENRKAVEHLLPTSDNSEVTDAELRTFCNAIHKKMNEHYSRHFDNLTVPTVSWDKGGRKWIRIVRENTCGARQRSVICFVERATGNIWKAASWKSPARNFKRGNIRSNTRYATMRA